MFPQWPVAAVLPVALAAVAAPPIRPAPPASRLIRPAPGAVPAPAPSLRRPPPATIGTPRITPFGLAADGKNGLFIADNVGHRVYRLDLDTGICAVVAGTGERGFSGDGGPALQARLYFPKGIAVDAAGDLFIADCSNHRVRRVDARTGTISTVAGNGTQGYAGDGGPAVDAALDHPLHVAVDRAGRLYIADTENQRVRVVDPVSGIIHTVAGNGHPGFLGDTGRATRANLNQPSALAVDAGGHLYVSDSRNGRVRRVDLNTGVITRHAGSWPGQPLGDRGPAHRARLYEPHGIPFDGAGNLYIADRLQHRIRRVDARTGIITTVAGSGAAAARGEGSPALQAGIGRPGAVTLDARGNLFFVDTAARVVRRVDARTGILTTIALTIPERSPPMAAERPAR
jgi:DNA-binding beta-propeller fold protein YncE